MLKFELALHRLLIQLKLVPYLTFRVPTTVWVHYKDQATACLKVEPDFHSENSWSDLKEHIEYLALSTLGHPDNWVAIAVQPQDAWRNYLDENQ